MVKLIRWLDLKERKLQISETTSKEKPWKNPQLDDKDNKVETIAQSRHAETKVKSNQIHLCKQIQTKEWEKRTQSVDGGEQRAKQPKLEWEEMCGGNGNLFTFENDNDALSDSKKLRAKFKNLGVKI